MITSRREKQVVLTMDMDPRIRSWIENAAGLPLQAIPDEGVCVRVSDARTDEPKNRLLAQRVIGKNGVLLTGIPRTMPDTEGHSSCLCRK
ncbi:MAG: hypothetical protein A2147_04595 [Chloroflexi bacterium RBG_16_57_8]|nr:MAG: hypothetical protein A2147_04595 [Chloroflexi bacterium RBG_16_57_8]